MYLNRDEEFLKMMNILESLKINIDNIKDNFLSIYSSKEETLKNKSKKLLEYIENQVFFNIESVKELKNPFLLFIVGPGNYGKSTLINALLEDNFIKTTDLPNTWKVDLFLKSNIEKVEIVYKDNSKNIKRLNEGIKILEKEEQKYKVSKKSISKKLREYKKHGKLEISELKKYKKILEDKYLYKSDILEIKYHINRNGLLDNFIIVDTPGLNQTLVKDTMNRMKNYYIRSDGVIWLVDAQNIVSKENNNIMNEIYEIDNLHLNSKNMILAVNKMDIIEKNNPKDILRIKKDTKKIYKDKFKDIVFISAKEALNGIVNNNQNLIDKSNIKELHSSIDENFKFVAQESQIMSKYKNLHIMKKNIINEINIYKRELYKDISRYNEADYELHNKTKNLSNYISDHLNQLKSKVNPCDFDLKLLKEDVKSLENICNTNLDKLYNTLYIKSNFSNNIQEKVNLNVHITKSKHMVMDYKVNEILSRKYSTSSIQLEDIFNKLTVKKSKDKLNEEMFLRSAISNMIEGLIDDIEDTLEDRLNLVKENINKLRNESFTEKYIDYLYINEHITYLNKIENILKNLG